MTIKTMSRHLASKLPVKLFFWFQLSFILVNYVIQVLKYQGSDTVLMMNPLVMRLLADGGDLTTRFRFLQLYPLLIILPAGFSFFDDKNSNIVVFVRSRIGAAKYYISLWISTFAVSFCVCVIPFCIEAVLFFAAFPYNNGGIMLGEGLLSTEFAARSSTMMFSQVFSANDLLYAILLILIWGLLAASFNIFVVAFSTVFNKIKVFLLVPVYVLLSATYLSEKITQPPMIHTYYRWYLEWYSNLPGLSEWYLAAVIVTLILCSVGVMLIQKRRDWLE